MQLTALLERMEHALSESAVQAYAELNRQFHDLILRAADSGRLYSLDHYVRPPAILRVLQERFAQANGLTRSMAEHRLIAGALLDCDGERAEAAMRQHIRSTMKSMTQLPRTARPPSG
jgi:DNA-binding GntR family transcriptional regulator